MKRITPCRVPGCPARRYSRGVCSMHYSRFMERRDGWEETAIYILEPYERDGDPDFCICEEPDVQGLQCEKCHKSPPDKLSTRLMTQAQINKINQLSGELP